MSRVRILILAVNQPGLQPSVSHNLVLENCEQFILIVKEIQKKNYLKNIRMWNDKSLLYQTGLICLMFSVL